MTQAELMLADELLSQGLAYWQDFQARKAAGTLTRADLDAAGAKLELDLAQLEADIKARQGAA